MAPAEPRAGLASKSPGALAVVLLLSLGIGIMTHINLARLLHWDAGSSGSQPSMGLHRGGHQRLNGEGAAQQELKVDGSQASQAAQQAQVKGQSATKAVSQETESQAAAPQVDQHIKQGAAGGSASSGSTAATSEGTGTRAAPSAGIGKQAASPVPGSSQQQTVSQHRKTAYNETHRRHPHMLPGVPILPDTGPAPHCVLTKGGWCGPYWMQTPVPAKPPPRGDKECPNNCHGLGWCNYDTGTCVCRAGYTGPDCLKPLKRACFNMDPVTKRDRNYTGGHWLQTRCAGICDDDIGMCYCPPETKYGRKVDTSRLPHRVLRPGRPLYWCQPNSTADGQFVSWTWNTFTYEDLLGPNGWCNADYPRKLCDCNIDGLGGRLCNEANEQVCMNQCTGHGECLQGFCLCHPGWYGHDCSRKKAGEPMEPGDEVKKKPWLREVIERVPAAEDPPTRPNRKRPFIYVYDMDPLYNQHIMQYRLESLHCSYRRWASGNHSAFVPYYGYPLETALHELMLTSEHRTFDPEEADYFYVPLYLACLADIVGKAERPFWPTSVNGEGRWGQRPQVMSMMTLDAQQWLARAYPYWNRTGGADHIFLMTHDEGACYAPVQIWSSIILSHWGRLDFPHVSQTQYGYDNYTEDFRDSGLGPGGWLNITSRAHACHDPEKHLVVPNLKEAARYRSSPYLGFLPLRREVLAFFRGDMRLDRQGCAYSRCIRQTLHRLAREGGWKEKYNFVYGDTSEVPGDYSEHLARAKFCLVLPGDGHSPRMEDAALHGCVPVIIMDNTLGPFESQIDYSKFSIRVAERELHKLVDILLAVTPERLKELQAGLAQAWMRFRWNGLPILQASVLKEMEPNRFRFPNNTIGEVPGLQWAQTGDDDAFSTVIQWLYHRIPHTRGGKMGGSQHKQR